MPIWSPLLERRKPDRRLEVLDGLDRFREHLGGTLTVTLPCAIGGRVEVHEIAPATVDDGVAYLKEYHRQRIAE